MSVRVHVASFNTRHATELCIRSARRYAGGSFELAIGESGSTDGSLDLIRRLRDDGLVDHVEVTPARQHAEWLDHWLITCPTRHAVFCDSDVEFLRDGWLQDLMDAALRDQAAIMCGEFVPEHSHFVEPVSHRTVRLAQRPSPWLMLVDRHQVPSDVGFAYRAIETSGVPEGLLLYDVGGYLAKAVSDSGAVVAAMPSGWGKYRHWGGLSWSGGGVSRHALRKRLDRARVRMRAAVARGRSPARPT